ncbi:TIGR02530 family flagellar biosynthesis protein [Salirhabdus salicampi]|uniref:TIGR02530 family flagellar biosynthesis protein n=1 Tax=Salirhabdus salicampi TaxID=476102 RepID=UPI0020C429FC|nr:TIGR02530 family flagellar biosynthesis protein [Salirhabdus salicampi]MCP8616517.1 hypothetical protein [Salirhabdus salicampi]
MDHRIHQLQHHPLQQMKPKHQNKKSEANKSFQSHLNQASAELKISKHAKTRLQERNIHISDTQWKHITEKVGLAKEKGVQDSLVVLNDATLIVNTKNQTVITAMDRNEADEQLFTNINGAILIND